jgi:hypothetical protein
MGDAAQIGLKGHDKPEGSAFTAEATNVSHVYTESMYDETRLHMMALYVYACMQSNESADEEQARLSSLLDGQLDLPIDFSNLIDTGNDREWRTRGCSLPGCVRLVCTSDTHSRHLEAGQLPGGDVFIHAGDFTVCT